MECKFFVGQKVVCVEPTRSGRLTVGQTYTVTYVGPDMRGAIGVILAEVKSPFSYMGGFIHTKFRPATDISQFRKIVADVKAGKREPVNA